MKGDCTHGYPRVKRVTAAGLTEELHGKRCPECPEGVAQESYRLVSESASVERRDFQSVVPAIFCALCEVKIEQYQPFLREGKGGVKHAEAKHCLGLAVLRASGPDSLEEAT